MGHVYQTSSQTVERLNHVYRPVRDGLARSAEMLQGLGDGHGPFLAELIGHVLESTGKQLRPAITLLSAGFHPNDGRSAEIMATAVELVHVATLIHDDTVDKADTRRGRPTVNRLWGPNVAVLLGDYIFATSATFVCDTGNVRVIRRFSETATEMSRGELEGTAIVYSTAQDMEAYLKRIYNKTASLFTTAAESGAILSGASEKVIASVKDYGYNVGMAYQIVDDILDLDGLSEEVGKPVGQDLAQGILTLPAIIALERSPKESPILEYLRNPEDQQALSEAVALARDPSIIEESYSRARDFGRRAVESLAGLGRSTSVESLEEVVHYVLDRRS